MVVWWSKNVNILEAIILSVCYYRLTTKLKLRLFFLLLLQSNRRKGREKDDQTALNVSSEDIKKRVHAFLWNGSKSMIIYFFDVMKNNQTSSSSLPNFNNQRTCYRCVFCCRWEEGLKLSSFKAEECDQIDNIDLHIGKWIDITQLN